MTDEANDKAGKADIASLKSRGLEHEPKVIRKMLVGLIVGLKEKAGLSRLAKSLNLKMSRDGLEPSTHWLKASFGDFE
jgi:hypothetical protein